MKNWGEIIDIYTRIKCLENLSSAHQILCSVQYLSMERPPACTGNVQYSNLKIGNYLIFHLITVVVSLVTGLMDPCCN